MPSHSDSDQANAHEDSGWSTKTRLILAAIGLAGFIALYLIAIYWLPGWWASFIGGIVQGRTTTGALVGGITGFIFSAGPILIFLMGMRLRKSWKGIIGWFVVALAFALPNILTIGVRLGTTPAAQSARNTLVSQEATGGSGFFSGSYVGIGIGIIFGLWVAWVTISRRLAKRKADRLAAEKEQQASSSSQNAPDSAHATSDHDGSSDASGSDDDGAGHDGTSGATDSGDSDSGDSDSGDSGDGSAPDAAADSWDPPSDSDAN